MHYQALLQCQVCLHPSLLEARHVPNTVGSVHPCTNTLLPTSRSPGGLSARRHLGPVRGPGLAPSAAVGRPPGDLPARELVGISRALLVQGRQVSGRPACCGNHRRLQISLHAGLRESCMSSHVPATVYICAPCLPEDAPPK